MNRESRHRPSAGLLAVGTAFALLWQGEPALSAQTEAKVKATPDPAILEQQAEQRDSMMTLHQGVGLGTMALLVGAGITGALLVGRNDPTTRLLHQSFVGGGTALYLAGGILALTAPKPFSPSTEAYEGGIDNITMHRWLAALHLAGMGAAVYSGLTATRLWEADPTLSIRRVHPLVGGASIALVATSAAVMVLNF